MVKVKLQISTAAALAAMRRAFAGLSELLAKPSIDFVIELHPLAAFGPRAKHSG
jgi:hypothetical protein